MDITDKKTTFLIRASIIIIVCVIAAVYYFSEIRPFKYSDYDKNISDFQRYYAELNTSLVRSRAGILKNNESLDKSLSSLFQVSDVFKEKLKKHPNPEIQIQLTQLNNLLQTEFQLVQEFKKINPLLLLATSQFSQIMENFLSQEANNKLIEQAAGIEQAGEQAFRQLVDDNIRDLYTGMLIYINFRTEERHQSLSTLIAQIKNDVTKLPEQTQIIVTQGLQQAEKILLLQPQLTKVEKSISELPIISNINTLDESFKSAYQIYKQHAFYYRIVLYFLLFTLLVLLRWAFAQLQAINRELEQRVIDRTQKLTIANSELNKALAELKEAQDQIIMQEKMASVGMLTTGIAHEIKNPLNFINNFSDISVDLVKEISEELTTIKEKIGDETFNYIGEIMADLSTNCSKIKEHGVRADQIVKTMLMHSQGAAVAKESTDIRPLMDTSIQVTTEAFRSTHNQFQATVEKDYASQLNKVLAAPELLGRVFSYIIDNALYAVYEKKQKTPADYIPTIDISIHVENDNVIIKIKDNGTGIPQAMTKKIFEPFFTTKPTGKGNTGLGLSICYDTIVKQHKGDLRVQSTEGVFTEFTILLPKESL